MYSKYVDDGTGDETGYPCEAICIVSTGQSLGGEVSWLSHMYSWQAKYSTFAKLALANKCEMDPFVR